MAGLNKVTLIGHLGAEPESRRLNNGNTVVNLRLATSETWRDKSSGERKEKTEWHTIVIWNEGLAKVAEQYLKKGSKIYVEGKLATRSWEQDGQKRYTTEVVLEQYRGELLMLDGKNDGDGDRGGRSERRDDRGGGNGGGGRQNDRGGDYGRESGRSSRSSRSSDMDDEIPF